MERFSSCNLRYDYNMLIRSLIDEDFYTATMAQAIFHNFTEMQARYKLTVRSDIKLGYLAEQVQAEIDSLALLQLTPRESDWLRDIRYMKSEFVDFLEIFRHNPKYVQVGVSKDGQLEIDIAGPWIFTLWFEIKILAIISELYMAPHFNQNEDLKVGMDRLEAKIEMIKKSAPEGFKFADFGTRRRFSYRTQRMVVEKLSQAIPQNFMGTSNMALACEFGITPIGTMSHQWLMAGQALDCSLKNHQSYMLTKWAEEYRGNLGYALSDTITLKSFLDDFDRYLSKLFDGVRLDSGDPFVAGEVVIQHYESLGIDPKTKYIIPSDSLDLETAFRLHETFSGRIGISHGIGTNLTNDCGVAPLSIVIKATHFNDRPVAKISDSPGKSMCPDPIYLGYLKHVFGLD